MKKFFAFLTLILAITTLVSMLVFFSFLNDAFNGIHIEIEWILFSMLTFIGYIVLTTAAYIKYSRLIVVLVIGVLLSSCNEQHIVTILETGQKVKIDLEPELYASGDTVIVSYQRGEWYIKNRFIPFEGLSKGYNSRTTDSTVYMWVDYKAIVK